MDEHRIISLLPGATEIVVALGLENMLVGRSHECDYPQSVIGLPVCSETRIDIHNSSNEIDRHVKTILQNALSVFYVHQEQLEQLQPTIILTQTQCDVCAVSLQDVQQAIGRLTSSHPEIISCEPNNLADVWEDIQHIADSLLVSDRATQLISKLRARISQIQSKTSQQVSRSTLVCIEWLDPLMIAGNWVPELADIAGGAYQLCQAGKHSTWATWEDLVTANPDVIVFTPCGFNIERTLSEISMVKSHPLWRQLRAVQKGNVFVADGNHFFNRSGPRLVDSAEILAEILHPKLFPLEQTLERWVKLNTHE